MIGFFMLFMLGIGLRNVSYNTLTTKVPTPRERARFLSIQSAVQHASASLGAFLSARMLSERADHTLVGMGASDGGDGAGATVRLAAGVERAWLLGLSTNGKATTTSPFLGEGNSACAMLSRMHCSTSGARGRLPTEKSRRRRPGRCRPWRGW